MLSAACMRWSCALGHGGVAQDPPRCARKEGCIPTLLWSWSHVIESYTQDFDFCEARQLMGMWTSRVRLVSSQVFLSVEPLASGHVAAVLSTLHPPTVQSFSPAESQQSQGSGQHSWEAAAWSSVQVLWLVESRCFGIEASVPSGQQCRDVRAGLPGASVDVDIASCLTATPLIWEVLFVGVSCSGPTLTCCVL